MEDEELYLEMDGFKNNNAVHVDNQQFSDHRPPPSTHNTNNPRGANFSSVIASLQGSLPQNFAHNNGRPPSSNPPRRHSSWEKETNKPWNNDSFGSAFNTIQERQQDIPPPRPPPYRGGGPSDNRPPPMVPRHDQQYPSDDTSHELYLEVSNPLSQNEIGKGLHRPSQPSSFSQRDREFPLPSREAPPPVADRPRAPGASHMNSYPNAERDNGFRGPPPVRERPPSHGASHMSPHPNEDGEDVYEEPNNAENMGWKPPQPSSKYTPPQPQHPEIPQRPDRRPMVSPRHDFPSRNDSGRESMELPGHRGGSTKSNSSIGSQPDTIDSPRKSIPFLPMGGFPGPGGFSNRPPHSYYPETTKRPERDMLASPSRHAMSRDDSGRGSGGSFGKRGGSAKSDHSCGSSSSGDHVDAIGSAVSRASPVSFQEFKPPTSSFSGHGGFGGRFPSNDFKPSPSSKPLPKTFSPTHIAEKSSKPSSGFKLPPFSPSSSSKPSSKSYLPPTNDTNAANIAKVLDHSSKNHLPGFKELSPSKPFPIAARRTSAPAATHRNTLESQPWYKDVDRHAAQDEINRNLTDGCFIVRPGSSENNPYSLTVCSQQQLYNVKIRKRQDDGKYAFGKKKANEYAGDSVIDLISHHMYTSLVLAGGNDVTLTGPP